MFVIALFIVELVLFVAECRKSRLYLPPLFCLLYLLTYLGRPERSGARSWPWLRSLRIWRWVGGVKGHIWQNESLLLGARDEVRTSLFVVGPNTTNLGLLWGFGLHGDRVLSDLAPFYAVPRFLLLVPLLRDVLLWSGAVEHHPAVVQDLLAHNHSVAVCPSGMRGILYRQSRNTMEVDQLPRALLECAIRNGAQLVPCVIFGESRRYRILPATDNAADGVRSENAAPTGCFRIVQGIFVDLVGYPFPLVFLPRFGRKMEIADGTPIVTLHRRQAEAEEIDEIAKQLNQNWRAVGNVADTTLVIRA